MSLALTVQIRGIVRENAAAEAWHEGEKKSTANRKEAEWKNSIGVSVDDDEVRTPAQELALQRIGVTGAVLANVPRITPLLKRADGGLKTVLAAMRLAAGDETISAFLCRYDAIPRRTAPACPSKLWQ
jgi:hypothetical protein